MAWRVEGSKGLMPEQAALSLAALGIVFGDIGTSPLYALQVAFGTEGLAITEDHVRGVLSLVFWSLLLIVGIKYVVLVMRADHGGEGGVMALLAQALDSDAGGPRRRATPWLIALAVIGATLLYGDGVITPAISVLSAVEGVAVYAPEAKDAVLPIALGVVTIVFILQRFGTGMLGVVLGPVMLLWFLAIAAIGVHQIIHNPSVLRSLSPVWAFRLWGEDPVQAFVLMGAIVLCITGTEAMFADMGHFGRRAIARAWWWIVLPSLLLNYLGQGAAVLAAGSHDMVEMAGHPFYASVPSALLMPVTILATIAAVIAAQAVITGAFSLTRQIIQQRLFPPVRVKHTSHHVEGQVYLPAVNRLMFIGCIAIMVGFQTSEALADAYGLAVSGMFIVTSILLTVILRRRFRWSWWALIPVMGFFLLVDVVFLSSNANKFLTGGWLPLSIAAVIIVVIWTWRRGNAALQRGRLEDGLSIDKFIELLSQSETTWAHGTAVFLSGDPGMTPTSLRKLHRHMPVLPDTIVLMHVRVLAVPYVPEASQVSVQQLDEHIWRLICRIGWRDDISIPDLVRRAGEHDLPVDARATTYWTRREGVGGSRQAGLPLWQRSLLQFLLQTSPSSADLFNLPPRRTMEIVVRGRA
ncbi:MAG: KUP/HAK/KT family potassium transporter [Phycisphaerales bacterium]|nr:KUP/HAK/KT family potassium transporter [Phycisphaerales bacterium]